MLRGFPGRVAFFLAFWVSIAGSKPLDLLVGFIVTAIAAAISLQLLPPGQWRFHPLLIVALALRFLRQSVVAGVDVAYRALHPRLPLRPGFVTYEPRLAGPACDAFCTMTSLLPGTLPAAVEPNGDILVHCLDTGKPVAEQLAVDEDLFASAIGGTSRDG